MAQVLPIAKIDQAELLRLFFDNVEDYAFFLLEPDGSIISWNSRAERILGYTAEDVIGKHVQMFRTAEDRDAGKSQEVLRMAAESGSYEETHTRVRKDGTEFIGHIVVTPLRDENAALKGYGMIVRDITEREVADIAARDEAERQREQLRQAQKMEAIGQLTGGVAHDFNNLLAIITGNLDFIADELPANDPLRNYINPAITAAMQGAELTKQLLAFSRRQALQPRVVAVNGLIEEFSNLVKRTLGEQIELVLSLSPNAGNIFVDQTQLETALLNLSVNARYAMPKGGKLIYETQNIYLDQNYANTHDDVAPGEYVLIAISDTGTGMTPEVMAKAFDPFFTTKELGKGSGLGLSMVYGFVKQSEGHVKLYSEVNRGTSVRIYLPRAERSAYEDRNREGNAPAQVQKKSKRILIVEDNADVLELTCAMATSLGYDVLTATDGDIGLKLLEDNKDIDLLLSDVMLPGSINGPILAKRALLMRPGIQVLFNSGYAEQTIIDSGIMEKGMHMLSKPFRKQQLADKLSELLGDSKSN